MRTVADFKILSANIWISPPGHPSMVRVTSKPCHEVKARVLVDLALMTDDGFKVA